MVKLFDVDEQNWMKVAGLRVNENQRQFLDSAIGIIARGYVWRACNARLFGIAEDEQIIGVAFVKDMDEEPACYDLQQFMIDAHFQNRGYGTAALRLILARLRREGKYAQVEVCVHKEDAAALKVYEKTGFLDTGYIDEACPDCLNLMYHFSEEKARFSDMLISDFSDELFQSAFRRYFEELGVHIRDWDALFKELNDEDGNAAYVRTAQNGAVIGFILFQPIAFTSSFFEETCGFMREFWVADGYRGVGHGTALLRLAERYFCDRGIFTGILTTDTAAQFYERNGYRRARGCKAKNHDDVFVKRFG